MPSSARGLRPRPRPTAAVSGSLGSTTTVERAAARIASSSCRPWTGVGPARCGPPRRRAPRRASARPGAAARGHDRRPAVAGLASRAAALLGEVGDPDPVRAAGLDTGLDGRADVVDVDVHVPQAVAAHDHERVAEPASTRSQHRAAALVRASSRYITSYACRRPTGVAGHAVRGTAGGQRRGARPTRARAGGRGARRSPPRTRRRAGRTGRGRRRPPRRRGRAPAAARGCAARASAPRRGGGCPTSTGGVGVGRAPAPRRRPRGDGEDRALDRAGDGGVRAGRWPAQRAAQRPAAATAPGPTPATTSAQPAQELAEDHPGVAAGAEERAPGQASASRARSVGGWPLAGAAGVATTASSRRLQGQVAGWCRCRRPGTGKTLRASISSRARPARRGRVGPAPRPRRVEALEHGQLPAGRRSRHRRRSCLGWSRGRG